MQTPSNDRPTTLRALAARCCAGETSDELRDDIHDVIGTSRWTFDDNGRAYRRHTPNPLTDLNASAAAMPTGWRTRVHVFSDECQIIAWNETACTSIEASAPTEPPARTAAALLAMAAELEGKC